MLHVAFSTYRGMMAVDYHVRTPGGVKAELNFHGGGVPSRKE